MKPFPHQADPPDGRDPFAARDDRTPEELGAIRALSAQLDALLDAPLPGMLEPTDDELEITQDALPILETTHVSAVIAGPDDEPPPSSVGLESGLADRMRGVLRGVLDRARKNRPGR